MKTYRKAKNAQGKLLDTHVIVEEAGQPIEVITEKRHPEKWAEYQASLNNDQETDKIEEEKPKKGRKKK